MLDQLYQQYLESKKNKWSNSTLRSESHRLTAVLSSGNVSSLSDPELVWSSLVAQGLAPYSRVKAFERISQFLSWAIKNNHIQGATNKFEEFRKENAQLFRNTYEKKIPQITYEDTLARLKTLDPEAQEKAFQIIQSALRYTESNVVKDGKVRGKGGKVRQVFNPKELKYKKSYWTFLRRLKSVGLKPHDLRKLAANHFIRSGGTVSDLKKLMGWESLSTAQSYVEALNEEVALRAECLRIK